jgi:hypothetical protein
MSCETIETLCNKQCCKCSLIYPINSFRKYSETSIGNTCKKCLNEYDKARKKQNRQKKAEQTLVYCDMCNQEKALKYFAKLKKFYKKKICISCYPKFLTEQKTNWCKNEHNTNMNYRIKKSLAARLRSVIVKNTSTMNYIGCNIQYLREWFEYNFTSEMNWDNYGTYWSIDHIIPVCKFNMLDEIEKFRCWNWSNLMPVTIIFNSSKKEIDNEQVTNIIYKLEKFKEEGSTTKWFSSEFILNKELAEIKSSINLG